VATIVIVTDTEMAPGTEIGTVDGGTGVASGAPEKMPMETRR
jgi:hypothetical protein